MPRARIIPDTEVFATLRSIIADHGEGAASFRAIGRAIGLAPATLVQRYGSAAGMLQAAMIDGWDIADQALAQTPVTETPKGAVALLKALPTTPPLSRDPVLVARAKAWRARVLKSLTACLDDAEAAAILFATWQGRMQWDAMGARGFSLRDAVKRLA
jgi:AcrR family transcriptional regulator